MQTNVPSTIHSPAVSDFVTPVFIELFDIDFGSFDCRPSLALAMEVLAPSVLVEAEPLFDAIPDDVVVLAFGGEAALSLC